MVDRVGDRVEGRVGGPTVETEVIGPFDVANVLTKVVSLVG